MVYSLAYVSEASAALTGPELLELLRRSREKNITLDVTGILLYRYGTFLQLLEGPQGSVDELYATIARDPRHHAVSTVLVEDRPERRFSDWTMGFGDVDGDFDDVAGFNDVLQSSQGPDGEESEEFRALLELFASKD
ncbi:MAG TPA: BLUF domain-containing protein [Friedmanniella sp.]